MFLAWERQPLPRAAGLTKAEGNLFYNHDWIPALVRLSSPQVAGRAGQALRQAQDRPFDWFDKLTTGKLRTGPSTGFDKLTTGKLRTGPSTGSGQALRQAQDRQGGLEFL